MVGSPGNSALIVPERRGTRRKGNKEEGQEETEWRRQCERRERD